jgi:hypothetical protein
MGRQAGNRLHGDHPATTGFMGCPFTLHGGFITCPLAVAPTGRRTFR